MATAIVTGSNSGIGYATALLLARGGRRVAAGMRDPSKGAALRQAAQAENLPLRIVPLDVTDPDAVKRAVADLLVEWGTIDLLVNNAGVGGASPIETMDEAIHKRIFEVNYFGAIRIAQAVLPAMRAQGRGHIVNVSSITGLVPMPIIAHYSASKCALEGAMEVLAHEVRRFGVRVCNVEPGYVETSLVENARENVRFDPDSPYRDLMRRTARYNKATFRIALTPDAVAQAIASLAENPDPPFRTVMGQDAEGMLRGRRQISDEEWIGLGDAMPDAEYEARFKALFGLDLSKDPSPA
jgi:NAD(P)-dependent dehydrogenase (short-subunit alcohol dehydrogenase family)